LLRCFVGRVDNLLKAIEFALKFGDDDVTVATSIARWYVAQHRVAIVGTFHLSWWRDGLSARRLHEDVDGDDDYDEDKSADDEHFFAREQ